MTAARAGLAALNRQARENAFDIDAVNWSLGVDHARAWMPEALTPLSFTPSYAALDASQRLRCNQLQAIALAGKFICFERALIHAVDGVRCGADVPPPLAQALATFVVEEAKHVAMFERLLRTAEPAWQGGAATRLFKVSALQRGAMALVVACPRTLLVWIWLAAFVEERALFLGRACVRSAPEALDPLHRQVHVLHLRDEARHCQLDSHLLACFYDAQPAWKKGLAATLLRAFLAAGLRAGAGAPNVVRQLGREFPALQPTLVPRLLAELRQLHRDPAYRRALFGRAALSRLHGLLVEHPEHSPSLSLLALEARS